MTDITITPANVTPGTGAVIGQGTAGATITAGQAVYRDSTDGLLKLADADAVDTADAAGIALHGASSGQPLQYQYGGVINIGATVSVGETYALSATPGGVCPEADLMIGDYVSLLGVGVSASAIKLGLLVSNIAHA